ncbi:MAG: phosphate transport system regulatory protein PhoU [Ignavibacteriales bacterium CG_4_9_14_3_um_filter_30_11]|nr:MAG: phosphate transport system regulatory protein PhoU [Ignavibacteriales bacterium CG_4_9_14_3_um_filter_30_11]
MSEKMIELLDQINKDIIYLANEVEDAIFRAIKSLINQDAKLAANVKKNDRKINKYEVEIETSILKLLALQQPVAVDLRFLIVALKMSNDLERMADHAKSIAKIALNHSSSPLLKAGNHIPDLGKIARLMHHDAVQSFIHRNSDLAREVLERDNEVDDLYDKIVEEIYEEIKSSPDKVRQGYDIMFAAKHLERVADLATNLCEDVVFMNDAEIIRYT